MCSTLLNNKKANIFNVDIFISVSTNVMFKIKTYFRNNLRN